MARRSLLSLEDAANDLSDTLIDPWPFIERIRATRRQLGKVRNADVARKRLQMLDPTDKATRDEIDSLDCVLKKRRGKQQRKLDAALDGDGLQAARPLNNATISLQNCASPESAAEHIVGVRLGEVLDARDAFSSDDPDRMHQLRIACKALSHALERSNAITHAGPDPKRLAALQATLGNAHDCASLERWSQKRGARHVPEILRAERERLTTLARQQFTELFGLNVP